MPEARAACADDLAPLLALFRASEVSAAAEPIERAERIWSEMLARDSLTVFVAETEAKIVSTCMLITAPNLLRSGRLHGFLENVVTHPDFRGRGFGRAVVRAARVRLGAGLFSRVPAKRPRRPARAPLLRKSRL